MRLWQGGASGCVGTDRGCSCPEEQQEEQQRREEQVEAEHEGELTSGLSAKIWGIMLSVILNIALELLPSESVRTSVTIDVLSPVFWAGRSVVRCRGPRGSMGASKPSSGEPWD